MNVYRYGDLTARVRFLDRQGPKITFLSSKPEGAWWRYNVEVVDGKGSKYKTVQWIFPQSEDSKESIEHKVAWEIVNRLWNAYTDSAKFMEKWLENTPPHMLSDAEKHGAEVVDAAFNFSGSDLDKAHRAVMREWKLWSEGGMKQPGPREWSP